MRIRRLKEFEIEEATRAVAHNIVEDRVNQLMNKKYFIIPQPPGKIRDVVKTVAETVEEVRIHELISEVKLSSLLFELFHEEKNEMDFKEWKKLEKMIGEKVVIKGDKLLPYNHFYLEELF